MQVSCRSMFALFFRLNSSVFSQNPTAANRKLAFQSVPSVLGHSLRYNGHSCEILGVPLVMLLWAQRVLSAMQNCPVVVELEVTEAVSPSMTFEVTPARTWVELTEHNSRFICEGRHANVKTAKIDF